MDGGRNMMLFQAGVRVRNTFRCWVGRVRGGRGGLEIKLDFQEKVRVFLYNVLRWVRVT